MIYLLILFAAILRFLPHEANFAPITALALFSGVYLRNRKLAIILPLLTMLVSDFFIGFYELPILFSVYASFGLSGILGLWLRNRKTLANIAGATLAASVQFYLLTNFAVWLFGTMYSHDLSGLSASYTNALPFFRGTLYGDLFYVTSLFGIYELARLLVRKKQESQITQVI